MAAGDLLQQLQQVGSALGPIAAGGVGLLIRAVKSVAAGVDEAKAAAKQAAGASQEAEKASKTAVGSFEAVSRAMRMELDTFKQEVEQNSVLASTGCRLCSSRRWHGFVATSSTLWTNGWLRWSKTYAISTACVVQADPTLARRKKQPDAFRG